SDGGGPVLNSQSRVVPKKRLGGKDPMRHACMCAAFVLPAGRGIPSRPASELRRPAIVIPRRPPRGRQSPSHEHIFAGGPRARFLSASSSAFAAAGLAAGGRGAARGARTGT